MEVVPATVGFSPGGMSAAWTECRPSRKTCALIRTPQLLLLDEPSVGVDPISRRELWKMVYALVDQGIGVVWSTSYLDEAERCAEVLLLNGGKVLYVGPPKELTAADGGA